MEDRSWINKYPARTKEAKAVPTAENIPRYLLFIFNNKTLAIELNKTLVMAVITAAK